MLRLGGVARTPRLEGPREDDEAGGGPLKDAGRGAGAGAEAGRGGAGRGAGGRGVQQSRKPPGGARVGPPTPLPRPSL